MKGKHEHVKLLSPSEQVKNILDLVGFSDLFDIFDDVYSAVNSFK